MIPTVVANAARKQTASQDAKWFLKINPGGRDVDVPINGHVTHRSMCR